MQLNCKVGVLAALILALTAGGVCAADTPVAVVNGVVIPARLMERHSKANVAQGQADSPVLRSALKQELIARELMVQEAVRRGLDKREETEDALLVLKQNLLIDVLLRDEFGKQPVKDEDLKAEYDRQVKLIKSNDLQQYQLSVIVLDADAQARSVLADIKAGQSFSAMARKHSVDASKEKGGDLGWLLVEQMTPAISNVVVNLAVGSVSAVPIQIGSLWYLVKVSAKRAYEVPTLHDSKTQLQAAVIQARRAALLKKLLDAAKIQ